MGGTVESCDEFSKSKVSINDYQLRELGLVPPGIIGVLGLSSSNGGVNGVSGS